MDHLCKYTSKLCNNERSPKEKGGYHNFCDTHRRKANQAQRRWYIRKSTTKKLRAKDALATNEDNPHGWNITQDRKGSGAVARRRIGLVTFRDASVAAAAMLSNSPSPAYFPTAPSPSPDHHNASSCEPYQQSQSMLWDDVAIPVTVSDDGIGWNHYLSFQAPLPAHNGSDLVSLSFGAVREVSYGEFFESASAFNC